MLRVEIKLSTKYLAESGLSKPSAWRGAKGKAVYQQQFDWLRTLLKVDADYRVNKPQQRHIDQLSVCDMLVLDWHLKGKPMNRFPEFKSGEWKKSPIKQRIQERLRIDIDIPWKTQCRIAIPGLSELLSLDRLVEPPKGELLAHCHMPATVKRKNRELRKRVDAALLRRRSSGMRRCVARARPRVKARAKLRAVLLVLAQRPLSRFPRCWRFWKGSARRGILVHFSSDGTTSDVSNLMG